MSKGKVHHDWILRRCCGSIAACILTLAVLVGFVALVIYLALHPSKPSFYLQDIQLRSIDLADPALSLDVQVAHLKLLFFIHLGQFTVWSSAPATHKISKSGLF